MTSDVPIPDDGANQSWAEWSKSLTGQRLSMSNDVNERIVKMSDILTSFSTIGIDHREVDAFLLVLDALERLEPGEIVIRVRQLNAEHIGRKIDVLSRPIQGVLSDIEVYEDRANRHTSFWGVIDNRLVKFDFYDYVVVSPAVSDD